MPERLTALARSLADRGIAFAIRRGAPDRNSLRKFDADACVRSVAALAAQEGAAGAT